MGKYEGYLIASDLDGTLINTKHDISGCDIDSIASFIKEGGLFAIATGRTEITALPYMEKLQINCPCILYNGAAIYDTRSNTFVRSVLLDKKQLLPPLSEVLESFPGLCMQIYAKGKLFVVSGESTMDPVLLMEKTPYELASIEDITGEDWIKVLMRDTNMNLQLIQEHIKGRVPEGLLHSVFSTSTYLELFADGVSKGSALEQLMELSGIKREKSIAIGDYCNDIEMVRIAGLGVATSNAHPLLKAAADVISVSNDEHAVSDLVNKLLPPYSKAVVRNTVSDFMDEKDDYIKIPV